MNFHPPATKNHSLSPRARSALIAMPPILLFAMFVSNIHWLALLMAAIVLAIVCYFINWMLIRKSRSYYLYTHPFPAICMQKLQQQHPGLTPLQCAEVEQGLRQFFHCYLESGFKFIAMPSKVVDDLWHEFILCTRDYEAFCQLAFGRFFHHQPSGTMTASGKKMNEGLRRCWSHACYLEEIYPGAPSRLPTLFALDTRFHIADGFYYSVEQEPAYMSAALTKLSLGKPAMQAVIQPASVFIERDIDGTINGFVNLKKDEENSNKARGWGGGGGGGGNCGCSGGCSGGCGGGCGGGE